MICSDFLKEKMHKKGKISYAATDFGVYES